MHAAVQRAPTVAGFVVLTPSRPLARRGATRGLDDIAPLPPAAAALRAGVWQGTAMSQPAWIAQRAAEERAALAAKTAELKAAAVTSPVILSAKKDAGPSKAAMAAAASRDRRANRRQSQIDISAAQAVRYPPPRPRPRRRHRPRSAARTHTGSQPGLATQPHPRRNPQGCGQTRIAKHVTSRLRLPQAVQEEEGLSYLDRLARGMPPGGGRSR